MTKFIISIKKTFIYVAFYIFSLVFSQHIDQLPVGLLAQLVERCTGIAEAMGLNPLRARIFFRSYFQLLVQ